MISSKAVVIIFVQFYYATNRKVAGSNPNEVLDIFQFTLGPGVYSTTNKKFQQIPSIYINFLYWNINNNVACWYILKFLIF
jgi:hypothetical protein